MYKEDESFITPSDDTKIWRYMDFTKLVSLLYTSSLFFTRVDKLDDPFEGSCPVEVVKQINEAFNIIHNREYSYESAKGYFNHLNKFTAVNCWHMNRRESVAMWKLYLKSNEGIAVQSTVKRLKDCLKDKHNDIFIGKVTYIDYSRVAININPVEIFYYPLIYKRDIFKHEQELRAVIRKSPKRGIHPTSKPTIYQGILVPVDLKILIAKIYLAPTSPS